MSYSAQKRCFDVAVSVVTLLLLLPVMFLIAILIRIFIGNPVFFHQARPGLNGRPFRMFKFRTMTEERGAGGELLDDAARLTKFGKTLRSSSLDELPELWNVVKGDMSLVGPRPLLLEYLPLYSDTQRRRHEVRPGITGLAQVNGRNDLPWEERFKLDVRYVDNLNFWLDAKIMLLTILKVIRRDGVSQQGHVSMSKFKGNG